MLRRAHPLLLLLLMIVISPSLAWARISALAVTASGETIVVGTTLGVLSAWQRGGETPSWRLETNGAEIVSLLVLPDEAVIALDRRGVLWLVEKGGRQFRHVIPFTGGIRATFSVEDFQPSQLFSSENRFERVHVVQANFAASRIWMSGDLFLGVYEIELAALRSHRADTLWLSDWVYVTFPDSGTPALSQKMEDLGPYLVKAKLHSFDVHIPNDVVSALAVCDSAMFLVGTSKGRFAAFQTSGSTAQDSKLLYEREVNEPSASYPQISGVACAKSGYGASIVFLEGENGQIQLWNTKSGQVLDLISQDGPGHPGVGKGVAFDVSGEFLLSTGDLDIRLWRVRDEKLEPLATAFVGSGTMNPEAVASPDGTFALAIGDAVFSLDPRSLAMARIAGDRSPPPSLAH